MSTSHTGRRLVVQTVALALALAAAPAQAQIMTFDANACSGSGSVGNAGSFVEDGYSLSFTGSGWAAWCSAAGGYAGSPAIFENSPGGTISLTQVGGGAFSIFSIDLATVYLGGSAGSAAFTGYINGGGTVQTTFNYLAAAGNPVFNTFYFGAGWDNLLSVEWTQDDPYHQFDNVALGAPSEVVPEPATMTLLATGLAGMAAARRKKRKL